MANIVECLDVRNAIAKNGYLCDAKRRKPRLNRSPIERFNKAHSIAEIDASQTRYFDAFALHYALRRAARVHKVSASNFYDLSKCIAVVCASDIEPHKFAELLLACLLRLLALQAARNANQRR